MLLTCIYILRKYTQNNAISKVIISSTQIGLGAKGLASSHERFSTNSDLSRTELNFDRLRSLKIRFGAKK